jgi:hypothetical protein
VKSLILEVNQLVREDKDKEAAMADTVGLATPQARTAVTAITALATVDQEDPAVRAGQGALEEPVAMGEQSLSFPTCRSFQA